VKKVEAMLATADVDKPLTRVAVGALAGAGTPVAQSAMARLVDARTKDRSFLDLLVPTMGFAAHPSVELEGALRRVAAKDERPAVRDMANLALGTAAANLQNEDPARARAIVDSFGTKLARATTPAETHTYMEVLANTGSEQAGKILTRYLDDDSRDVRARAAEAMRLVPTKDAEERLGTLLRGDDDEKVRAGAAWALSYRQPSAELTRVEADALAVEQDAAVAKRLVDNLWMQRERGDTAQVTAAIEATAKSHPVAAVREQAQSYLAQLEKKPS
jgi:HEAT repeat protein